jgi:hypothetical protein
LRYILGENKDCPEGGNHKKKEKTYEQNKTYIISRAFAFHGAACGLPDCKDGRAEISIAVKAL